MQTILAADDFTDLLTALRDQGYRTIAPTIRDHGIIYDEISTVEDLPIGWTDVQEKGKYTLERREDEAYFGYNLGPHSWRRFFDPPKRKLWSAQKQGQDIGLLEEAHRSAPLALIGVRACELEAIKIQDKVYLEGSYQDPHYKNQRAQNLIVAVNCVEAGNTCFCVSSASGPAVQNGYDIVLTECVSTQAHFFVLQAGSDKGREICSQLNCPPATLSDIASAEQGVAKASQSMGRSLDAVRIKTALVENQEHPFWEQVAERCLSCANCTMVCPTCFCSTIEDTTDLSGDNTERWQTWDSCFSRDFSYIHGGSVRHTTKSRYRQWMSHKLSSWYEQFDSSGCVGCGRCITWCPVGIDITEGAEQILTDSTVAKVVL